MLSDDTNEVQTRLLCVAFNVSFNGGETDLILLEQNKGEL